MEIGTLPLEMVNFLFSYSDYRTDLYTVVEIGISKPNGCQVFGPIFLESTTPRVFKTDIKEFADFHETLQILGGDFTK